MTPTRVAAIAAIVASVGLAAFTPAMAEGPRDGRELRQHRMLDFRAGAGGRFEFAQFSCAPKAADRMERRFDRLANRLKLTDGQKALYDSFITAALTAQTGLADKCADLRPDRAAATPATPGTDTGNPRKPDLLDHMETRLKFDEARIAAMNAVFPDFKAFYGSLTDEQKSGLFPSNGRRHGNMKARPTGLNG